MTIDIHSSLNNSVIFLATAPIASFTIIVTSVLIGAFKPPKEAKRTNVESDVTLSGFFRLLEQFVKHYRGRE